MASKRRNMFYENKMQETTAICHPFVIMKLTRVLFSDIENLLGRPIQDELARETGLDVALETLMDVEKETVGVCRQVSMVMKECEEAESAAMTTGDRLRELRHQVESTLRHCQAKDRPLCDTISLTGLDLRFSTRPVSSQQIITPVSPQLQVIMDSPSMNSRVS
ncbi:hypothetical protein AAG570_005775 [Ranatra chinensis]|uniref:Uncharacterized protein n=1 Tax=Ranatra chinensis TaxID=642074 RepID=A0ABD0Y039_9HEMI